MLKSCQYCGRIHDKSFVCQQKQHRIAERQSSRTINNKKIYAFHRSQAWKDMSKDTKQRDGYCCQICVRGLYNPDREFETDDLSVHHIIPVAEDWERKLDGDILLTLCRRHHEMAEKGEIPRAELLRIAEEQEAGLDFQPIG